jgi:hypothetical protein
MKFLSFCLIVVTNEQLDLVDFGSEVEDACDKIFLQSQQNHGDGVNL